MREQFPHRHRFAARTGSTAAEIEGFFDAVRHALQPKPDSIRLLRALAARRTPLYGLSNMSQPIYEWLRERHDFFGLFDAVVVSGAVRLVKPEPAIYRHLADTHGLVPGHTLFIDDLSQPHLAGMKVDFVTSLESSGFVFDNPNAASKCACGKSFG